jgi:hypothetical protein
MGYVPALRVRINAANRTAGRLFILPVCCLVRMVSTRLREVRMQTTGTGIPISLRILALFLRLVFIAALIAIAVRVSLPQSETLWSVQEIPGDLVRLALGLAVCLWVGIHLFTLPKTAARSCLTPVRRRFAVSGSYQYCRRH